MRISIIGGPCSGKTTTAAMAFATLKETGINCEFVVEQARVYIAKKRYEIGPENKLVLEDEDQLKIMQQQIQMEDMYDAVCDKNTIVICDSSPFNSLLYMSPDVRETALATKLVEKAVFNADLVFYAPLVEEFGLVDLNRVHDREQSLAIDSEIPKVLQQYAPSVWKTLIPLQGHPQARLSKVTSEIMLRRY